jgi:general secretion pathway protein L
MTTSALPTHWLSMQARRIGLTDFWRWWTAELRAALLPSLAPWLPDDATLLDVTLDEQGLQAVGKTPRRIEWSDEAVARRAALDALVRERGRDVRVLLDPACLLVKHVRYPQATEENLRDVMAFDMDRQTPFTADQIVFDARVVARDTARGMITIELAVLTRAALQSLLAPLKEAGCVIHHIGMAGDTGVPALEFLAASDRPARRLSRMQRIQLAMAAVAGVLVLAAVLIPILQKRQTIVELNPEVARAEAEADATRRIEAEYQKFAQQYNFLTAKKHTQVPALEVIEELTRLSPDTTWLTSLEIKSSNKAREITLQGEAASASKVIEVLEQSPLLQNASQRSQITRGAQPNTERFNIASELKPRPQPAFRTAAAPTSPTATPTPAAAPAPVLAPAAPMPSTLKASATVPTSAAAPAAAPSVKPTPAGSGTASTAATAATATTPASPPTTPAASTSPAVAKPPVAAVPAPGAPPSLGANGANGGNGAPAKAGGK